MSSNQQNNTATYYSKPYTILQQAKQRAFSVSAVYLQQFPSYSNHNCKNSSFLRTPSFIFCLHWGRSCGNHAKRCMNEKTIQCLPNPSQHVPIYLQQFPSYSNRKCKKSPFFHVPQPTFLFPLETPLGVSRHAICCMDEKTIQCLPNPSQHVPIYLEYFPSYTMLKSIRKSKNRYFLPHFGFPWGRPWGNHAKCCMDGNCLAVCAHLTITVSQIEPDIGRKSSFFHTPLAFDAPLGGGVPVGIAPRRFVWKN